MRGSEDQPAQFAEIDLTVANIEGQVALSDVVVRGGVVMTGIDAQTLILRGSNEEPPSFANIDLTLAKIKGEMILSGLQRAHSLILSNAEASLLVEDGSWPATVKLDGFRYGRLFNFEEQRWRDRYLKNWLEKDSTYTPQPYEQLAAALRIAGEPKLASDALYASRERERRLARGPGVFPGWRFVGLTLLNWTIGYGLGYRYFRSVIWIAGLTCLGVLVLLLFPHDIHDSKRLIQAATPFVYSLQKLLPVVKFEEFEHVTLSGFAQGYFYAHQLVGVVLAGFLTAGLAGLTQKS